MRCFCDDFDATQTAHITHISRVTINRLFDLFRKRIIELTNQNRKMRGSFEVEESYFGPKRIRGKSGKGAGGKIPVLELLKKMARYMYQ